MEPIFSKKCRDLVEDVEEEWRDDGAGRFRVPLPDPETTVPIQLIIHPTRKDAP